MNDDLEDYLIGSGAGLAVFIAVIFLFSLACDIVLGG